jgi:hypothetical protein
MVMSERNHLPVVRVGSPYGVAQGDNEPAVGNASLDIEAGMREVQVRIRGLTDSQLVCHAGEQFLVTRLLKYNLASIQNLVVGPLEIRPFVHEGEEMRLLVRAHVDLGMTGKIVVQGRGPGLGGPGYQEIGPSWRPGLAVPGRDPAGVISICHSGLCSVLGEFL